MTSLVAGAVAAEADATPAQVGLAWLLAQGDDIAPMPGTKRVARVEENIAVERLELSGEQIERLNNLTPAAGERHEEAVMRLLDRWSRQPCGRGTSGDESQVRVAADAHLIGTG